MSAEPIRLLIAEDETVVRHALAELLGMQPDILVAAQAPNGEAAVVLARQYKPQVILMDVNMPKMTGIEACRAIKAELPDTQVVMLTVSGDDETLFSAIKAGACGYVLKEAPLEHTLEAIRAAAQGECFIDRSLVGRILGEFTRLSRAREEGKAVFAELTRREIEILELIGQGKRNRDIAAQLFISEKTVKNHVSSILHKLQLNDRTEAALLAARYGLTDRPRQP